MAQANLFDSALRIVLYDGEDIMTGDPIYKYKTFNNVKTEATPDQLLAIANAFVGLQERSLTKIERKDSSDIYES
ncbi:DUF1659 domain-containing protein [Oceanobacillus halotolerans]|uniref:DUF1659 domain-containing protein n=1 Tax=Oceanobacillus halotolerans TaxID=2663380 RepID=UPI0013DB9E24|nr:DUF1659 domain-containing protein [Oceanobacillus halotolerans]